MVARNSLRVEQVVGNLGFLAAVSYLVATSKEVAGDNGLVNARRQADLILGILEGAGLWGRGVEDGVCLWRQWYLHAGQIVSH